MKAQSRVHQVDAMLAGKFHDGDTVRVEAKDGEIALVPATETQPEPTPEALPAT